MRHGVLLGVLVWGIFGSHLVRAAEPGEATIEFNRDIRPILSNHCFVCHGPDNNLRKADLRLDQEKDLFDDKGGYHILVPGKPQESEFFKRIISTKASERMPPAKAKKDLTKAQIDLLQKWIAQGAKYQQHWSLIAPTKVSLPNTKNKNWAINPIDHFILARLEKKGLSPSAEADRRTLIRRLSFDLTGLPPSPAEVDAFLADSSPQAYEKLVDKLLASPHYGERMALYWLDLVRYADTGGYHSDNHRDVYLFRDWVIESFNKNLPFDRFTTEQIAGDLLPKPTLEQKIASGYNRLLQTTEEGGAQAKEYQAKYYADRVRNFSTVWLGMTLGCSECHDHKYDPFTTKEFYQMASFFADIQEKSVGRQTQTPLLMPAQEEMLKKIEAQIDPLQKEITKLTPQVDKAQIKWEEEVRTKGIKDLPNDVAAVLAVEPGKRNPKQKEALTLYYRKIDKDMAGPQKKLEGLQAQKDQILKAAPTTLVSMSGPPRTMRVLPRGNWLDETGEIVQPETPAVLPKLDGPSQRATRLDLAKWVVAPENPLTARVFANRLWMLFFGQGIVKTLDDFGAQGTWPTHPELLDWLAVEFREKGWDVKDLVKIMVLSNTYRQSSVPSEKLKQRDPYNQLFARQARFRLDAEFVRDNALAISGLLVHKVGGPSAKPYQPAGYWAYLNFPKREWMKDSGENQYRRGLYTYWQRTFLHPSLLAFDASTREECTVERTRSNTPQQALVLLNDPTYVEASRVFAERILKAGGKTTEERIRYALREALQRPARPEELKVLQDLVERHLAQYQADPKSAEALLRVGDSPVPANIPAPELAAWTNVARVIINLHETITRN
jgi:hypothetical protein